MSSKIAFIGGEDVSSRIPMYHKLNSDQLTFEIVGSQKAEVFQKAGIPYHFYPLFREFNLLKDIKAVLGLRRIIKNEKLNIIHSFDTKPTLLAPLAAMGLRSVSVVRTITGIGRIFTEDNFYYRLLRFVYVLAQRLIRPFIDITIFQNNDDHAYFLKKGLVSNNKSRVIKGSGVDLSLYGGEGIIDKDPLRKSLGIKEGQVVFSLVCRLVKQKGVLEFLEAAKHCSKMGLNYKFLLIGPEEQNGDKVSLRKIEEYKANVDYLGRRNDIKELFSITDVFVLPTYYREGVPRVLMEAGALRVPCIATDMPGCKDFIKHDWNGLLVKPRNSKALSLAIKQMGENPELRKKFADNTFSILDEFSLDAVSAAYLSVYNSLLQSR